MGRGPDLFWWGHGWGQSHAAFLPLAQSLAHLGEHKLLDFPGFGQSPKPDEDWDTADYADSIAQIINKPIIWGGHSFGGRVGIRLAAQHPDKVKALILIAGAGLKKKRSLLKALYFKARIGLYKGLKKLVPLGLSQDWLLSMFGSRDYKNAGAMHGIFKKTIAEDLSELAAQIKCPVLLIYGEDDKETPPEFGERYHALIENSELHILSGQDHYSVLSSGRHQIANLILEFVKTHNEQKTAKAPLKQA